MYLYLPARSKFISILCQCIIYFEIWNERYIKADVANRVYLYSRQETNSLMLCQCKNTLLRSGMRDIWKQTLLIECIYISARDRLINTLCQCIIYFEIWSERHVTADFANQIHLYFSARHEFISTLCQCIDVLLRSGMRDI